jgi:hypothetical protein
VKNTPDWAEHVRPRLASLRLSPAREQEIVQELSQHLEDRWRDPLTYVAVAVLLVSAAAVAS